MSFLITSRERASSFDPKETPYRFEPASNSRLAIIPFSVTPEIDAATVVQEY